VIFLGVGDGVRPNHDKDFVLISGSNNATFPGSLPNHCTASMTCVSNFVRRVDKAWSNLTTPARPRMRFGLSTQRTLPSFQEGRRCMFCLDFPLARCFIIIMIVVSASCGGDEHTSYVERKDAGIDHLVILGRGILVSPQDKGSVSRRVLYLQLSIGKSTELFVAATALENVRKECGNGGASVQTYVPAQVVVLLVISSWRCPRFQNTLTDVDCIVGISIHVPVDIPGIPRRALPFQSGNDIHMEIDGFVVVPDGW
jgi:hypothetical protein